MKKIITIPVLLLCSSTFGQTYADENFIKAWSAKHNSDKVYDKAILNFNDPKLFEEWNNNKIQEIADQNSYVVTYDATEKALKISFKYLGDGEADGYASKDNYDGSVSFGYGYTQRNKGSETFNPFIDNDSIVASYIDMTSRDNRQMRLTYKIKNLSDSASLRFDLYDVNDRMTNYNTSSVKRDIKPSNSWQTLLFRWNMDEYENTEDMISGWNEYASTLIDGYSGHWWNVNNGHYETMETTDLPSVPKSKSPFLVPLDSGFMLPKLLLQINSGSKSDQWISAMDAEYLDSEFEILIKKIEIGDLDNNYGSTFIYGDEANSNTFSISEQLINTSSFATSKTFGVETSAAWSVSSNASWVSPIPSSGSGNGQFNIVITANSGAERSAVIKVISSGQTKEIIINQQKAMGALTEITISAGNLESALSDKDINSIVNLKVEGTMNILDFEFIKDLPNLTYLDLSDVNITAYSDGQVWSDADKIPANAFIMSQITTIILPESTKVIGQSAFSNCISLVSVTLPYSIESIGEYAFYNCISLVEFNFESSLKTGLTGGTYKSIGKSAFENCLHLKSFTIPESLQSIGENAFKGCSMLNSITVPNSVSDLNFNLNTFDTETYNNCVIIVPKGSISDFRNNDSWNRFSNLKEYTGIDINTTAEKSIKISPNPSNGKIKISTEFESSVIIYDINGKIIKNQHLKNSGSIELTDLHAGIYFVKFITDTNSIIKRFIVE